MSARASTRTLAPVQRLATVLAALVLSLAPAGAARAQIGPLPPVPPPAPPPAPTIQSKDEGLSTTQQLLIVAAAAALIGVIAWVIVRDARRSAPAERPRDPDAAEPSAREVERAKRQRRDKAKAARQQRKRNRRR